MRKVLQMTNQNEIDFIAAHNGGIQMFSSEGVVGWGNTADMIAYVIKTKGIAETVMGSSSIDFASEEGFATDNGAKLLWAQSLELV